MTSDKSYEVVSPNSDALPKSEVFVVYPDGEHWAHVHYLHIASIGTAPNGRGRRKSKGK